MNATQTTKIDVKWGSEWDHDEAMRWRETVVTVGGKDFGIGQVTVFTKTQLDDGGQMVNAGDYEIQGCDVDWPDWDDFCEAMGVPGYPGDEKTIVMLDNLLRRLQEFWEKSCQE